MIRATADIPGGNTGIERSGFPPEALVNRDSLHEYLEKTYGAEVSDTVRASVEDQEGVVDDVMQGQRAHADATVDGDLVELKGQYRASRQEMDRRDAVLEKAKEEPGPFRKAWELMKKHKYKIVTAVVIAAALWFGWGYLHEGLAWMHEKAAEAGLGRLGDLDAAPGALSPGMGPGMETPGGGVLPPMRAPLEFEVPSGPGAPPPPDTPMA